MIQLVERMLLAPHVFNFGFIIGGSVERDAHQLSRATPEIENAKQTRVVRPHPNKVESRFAGERCEFLRRILV